MYDVYILVTDSGVPFYVGVGNENRINNHLKGSGGREEVNKIIKEHRDRGSEIEVKIIRTFTDKSDAFSLEVELISNIGRVCDGGTLVNKTTGGAGVSGYELTDEQRDNISSGQIRRFSKQEERDKISSATREAMRHESIRDKCRNGIILAWSDPDFRERQVKAHTGKKDSESTKLKKSESCAKSWAEGKRSGKYSDKEIAHVYSLKGVKSPKEVALLYGMNPTYVSKIWRHERCKVALKRLGVIS